MVLIIDEKNTKQFYKIIIVTAMNRGRFRTKGLGKRSWKNFQVKFNTVLDKLPGTDVGYRVYEWNDIKKYLTLDEYYAFNRFMGNKQYPLKGCYIATVESFIRELTSYKKQ